jgi:outer membrane lipoprotein LolB
VRRLSLGLLALLLSACATTPPALSPAAARQAWQRHLAQVETLRDWTLAARIAIHTEREGWNGQLQWHQTPSAYQIFFNAPFGQGAVQLQGDARGVVMRDSAGETYTAPDAESLLYERLGWRLPLDGLRFWVTGLPEPHKQHQVEYDFAGRLASLQQAEWHIRYPGYQRVDGVDLPEKVYIENHDLSVRLVIDRWQFKRGA